MKTPENKEVKAFNYKVIVTFAPVAQLILFLLLFSSALSTGFHGSSSSLLMAVFFLFLASHPIVLVSNIYYFIRAYKDKNTGAMTLIQLLNITLLTSFAVYATREDVLDNITSSFSWLF